MSVAEESLRLTGLFEAEVLLELMLRFWDHPFCNDRAFRNELLERAVEILRLAVSGTSVLADVSAANMNFIAAVWCAELSSVSGPGNAPKVRRRQRWLDAVRRAVPSCFCDPGLLP
jgi:hypothetical protein